MKKRMYLILCILACIVLAACGSIAPESYLQRESIPEPAYMEMETGSTTLTFYPGDGEFVRAYEALMQTWWLTAKDAPDSASSGELVESEGLHELKTQTLRTYRQKEDIYVVFHYPNGIYWTDFEGKDITVKSVFFLIPRYVEGAEYVRGYFSASESGEIGINEGMYTFYYPAEMTDGFFRWLTQGGEDVREQPAYSREQAMLEGFVVMQDGDVRHNAGAWFAFLASCEAGKPAQVTVAQYTMGNTACYYNVTFDGSSYIVASEQGGQRITETAEALVRDTGSCGDTMEPYDSYEAYFLNDIVLYRDLMADLDYEGVTEIFLHVKEGEPPVKTYTGEAAGNILQLLMTADYLPAEPESYLYGMKLLMTNRDGRELVIELDLQQGNYRYGMQTYAYGEVSDLLAALEMDRWPDPVLEEFGEFLNEERTAALPEEDL